MKKDNCTKFISCCTCHRESTKPTKSGLCPKCFSSDWSESETPKKKPKLFASIRIVKANNRIQAMHDIENCNAQFIDSDELSDVIVELSPELRDSILNAI